MKRLKIWLSNFTLLQQFLGIVLLNLAILVFFVVTFLNTNIDKFVNNQMFAYIHNIQVEFLNTRKIDNDTNTISYIYSVEGERYLNTIDNAHKEIIARIDPNPEGGSIDDSFEYDNLVIVYSIITFDDDYRLISLVKNDYRNEFRDALLTGIVNVTFYIIGGMISILCIWIISLIRPLNQIKNYINRVKEGEKATLVLDRYDEIGEVGEALTQMNDELSKQQKIRDEMIQNISHDLKTPIAIIKSYSESIKDGVYPYDTLEKSVDVILENANRLEKKVYSLITYNKLGYLTDINDDILNLHMAPIIQKALLGVQVIRNDVKIETNVDETVFFHGEEEPWRVVVENLLDNSLRYAKSLIKITLKKDILEVYNDGPNMDKDRLDKLFKPYEKGTKGKFGLGLSIVKKVCDTYGYTVTGENMPDGVVFRIYCNKKYKKASKKKSKKV